MLEEKTFGTWLKRKRKALDLTREQLAERVGYSAATIRKIEDEERRPSTQIAERLAEIFNVADEERTVFLEFARGDWRSSPGETKEDAPWQVPAKSHRSNVPAPVTSLVGRGREITEIRDYLLTTDVRLVTLRGPPGIGKTRLSIETARASLNDFPDGVFFVALASLNDPTLIAPTIAHTLGYVEVKNLSTDEQLMKGIGEKQMLIVLDNCEHLIENVAPLASALLSACSYLKILATSRESLRIPGEWLYAVTTFKVPDMSSSVDLETAEKFPALTLFAERARAVRSDFVLNPDNIETVTKICAHVDGLPLAIELIAARMRLMSPQALLERLNERFILSADGMRAATERQKTLNNAIAWSYNLLSTEEQNLFIYLSVFSGGFTLEAAEAMFSRSVTEKSISDLIALLLDKSLLQHAFDPQGAPRYTMLVTIQEFAKNRLRETGRETEIRNWHLTYFLDLAEQASKELRGPNQISWLHRLDLMRDNLRAPLDWAIETGQTEAALQMARKLHWFWFVIGDHNEGRQWLGRVLAMPEASLYPEAYADALTQIAHHTWLQIGPKEARPLVEQALSVARTHDDKWNTARALIVLGVVMANERSFAAAQSTLEESQPLFQEVGDKWNYAHTLMGLGLVAYIQDNQTRSLTLHEQALVLFDELGDRYFQGAAQRFIGNLLVKQGDWMGGKVALREALIVAQELDSKWETYAVIWSLADAAHRAGEPARAVQFYWAAKKIADSVGAWQQEDDTEFENNLASCRAVLGEGEFAAAVEQGRAMTMEQAIAYALETRE